MNVKKSLENRIRGWFPKEPTLLSAQVKVNCEVNIEIKNPPPKIPQGYTIGATKNARTSTIGWMFYGLFVSIIFFLNNELDNIALLVAWVIVGVAVGIISGKMYTQNQLRRLLKEVEIHSNRKDRILAIVPFLIVFPFGFLVSWVLFVASITSTLAVVTVSFVGAVVSQQLTKYALFRSFEKKVDMLLMMRFGGGIVVVPKPPNSNSTV